MNLKVFGFFLLLLLTHKLAAQTTSSYKEVDALVTNFPINVKSLPDLRVFQNEIKRQLKTEDELARAAFVWITENIAYDCEGYRQHTGLYELEKVVLYKRGICAGYAALYKDFCDQFGLECNIVNGYVVSRYTKLPDDKDSIKLNHAWNVVKVNGTWQLVDPTWGSGYAPITCDSFTRERAEYYFYAKPEEFIKSHFPGDGRWQLLETKYNAQQFLDSVRKYREEMKKYEEFALEADFVDSTIKKQVGQTVRFIFNTTDSATSVDIWSAGEDGFYYQGTPVAMKDGYYFDFKIEKAGKYRVTASIYNYHGEPEVTAIQSNDYILDIRKATPSRKPFTKPAPKK